MSDYLGDLIKRTEEAQGSIRPYLGSIFEPVPGVGRGLPELGASLSPWVPVDSELEAPLLRVCSRSHASCTKMKWS